MAMLFDLIPSDIHERSGNNLVVEDSVIALRWCINKDVMDYIKKSDIKHPHVLIVVVNIGKDSNQEMIRKLVPMTEMMTFIQFARAGINRVFAAIVYPSSSNPGYEEIKSMKKKVLNKSGSSYDFGVLDYNDERWNFTYGSNISAIYSDSTDEEALVASIDFDVPAQLFAPEPAEWEKWWVNLMHEDKPIDQCHFRKRRLFAYTIQPILLLIINLVFLTFKYLTILFLVTVAVIRGIFDFDWNEVKNNIIHPWSYNVRDIWDEVRKSETIYTHKKDKKYHRCYDYRGGVLPWFRPTMLLAYVVIVVILYTIVFVFNWVQLSVLLVFLGGVLFVCAAFAALYFAVIKNEARIARSKKREEDYHNDQIQRERNELSFLLCSTGNEAVVDTSALRPQIKALPENKQTVKLKFYDFKKKICKPFQR